MYIGHVIPDKKVDIQKRVMCKRLQTNDEKKTTTHNCDLIKENYSFSVNTLITSNNENLLVLAKDQSVGFKYK